MTVVVGIDGCPGGWLCISRDLASGATDARILSTIGALLSFEPQPGLVMVDIPIGLTDAGARMCDLEARRLLRAPRASSVFPAPIRPVLIATTYANACEIGEKNDGRKLSQQAWAIVPKIREVDSFLRADPSRQMWVREVHPELCFRTWNGGTAMAHRKKSVAGRQEREMLVTGVYGEAYVAIRRTLPRGAYANDDVLDAFAALWTAERAWAGIATAVPEQPHFDAFGLRMEMVM